MDVYTINTDNYLLITMLWNIEGALAIQLAIVQIEGVCVREEEAAFSHLIQCAGEYKLKYEGRLIGDVDGVEYARRLFRAIGLDPTKHRPASEALLNRALKGKEFYAVNTLVDIGNWCSLDFLLPICVYDADKIIGDVTIRKGHKGEAYIGLNNRTVNLYNRYVIVDQEGPFGSPITDSQRTAVSVSTTNAVLEIFAPKEYATTRLNEKAVLFAQRTKDFCGGAVKNIELLGS